MDKHFSEGLFFSEGLNTKTNDYWPQRATVFYLLEDY